jgi:hypothetical protein
MIPFSAIAGMQGAGTLLQMYGLKESGRAARKAAERNKIYAEFSAQETERDSGLAIALGQRAAMEEKRQSNFVASRALAVAAASGGSVSDPTIVKLLTNIKGEGAYRAGVAMYEGESQARKLRLKAISIRAGAAEGVVEGVRQERAYRLAAYGVGLGGAASLYSKYGRGGPGAESFNFIGNYDSDFT